MAAITTAVQLISELKKKIRVIKGGTYAGKTYSLLLIIIQYALLYERKRISIVSETIPAVKQGPLLLFKQIMGDLNIWDDEKYNGTERIYTFQNDTTIQFTAYDTVGKAKAAGKRDLLFINEANYMSKEIAFELINRTDGAVYLDYNPNSLFWVDEDILPLPYVDVLKLTYKHNEALSEEKIKELEHKRELAKTSKYWENWCRVYLDGEIGQLDNVCISDYSIINSLPKEAQLMRIGLDFGFNPDPLACVEIYKYNDGIIANEIVYQTNLSLSEIINSLKNKNAPVICDASQPLMINELKRAGINAYPSISGAGSIVHGIEKINQIKLFITASSKNLIKEIRNYLWVEGKPTGTDHAIDALRYAVVGTKNIIGKRGGVL